MNNKKYNPNDRLTKKIEQEKERLKDAAAQDRVEDIRLWTLAVSHPATRYVLKEILDRCEVYNFDFIGSAEIHYKQGKASIGKFVLAKVIDVAPDRYLEMVTTKDLRKELINTLDHELKG